MNMENFEKLRTVRAELDELKKTEKELKRIRAELESTILAEMTEHNIPRITQGNKTFSPKLKLHLNKKADVDPAAACAAMQAYGYDDFTSLQYNANGLKAYIAERLDLLREDQEDLDADEAIPEELREFFSCYEEPTISMTTAR